MAAENTGLTLLNVCWALVAGVAAMAVRVQQAATSALAACGAER